MVSAEACTAGCDPIHYHKLAALVKQQPQSSVVKQAAAVNSLLEHQCAALSWQAPAPLLRRGASILGGAQCACRCSVVACDVKVARALHMWTTMLLLKDNPFSMANECLPCAAASCGAAAGAIIWVISQGRQRCQLEAAAQHMAGQHTRQVSSSSAELLLQACHSCRNSLLVRCCASLHAHDAAGTCGLNSCTCITLHNQ